MKNDKREITLNEKDSFADMLETEKGVLKAYFDGALLCKRKEVRLQIVSETAKIFEDIFFLLDVLYGKDERFDGN
ncbi:MAG: hypothetical protein IIX01_04155 [Clostridia bacterium]|nr:hypothetical protein [Clostridia bacterium]